MRQYDFPCGLLCAHRNCKKQGVCEPFPFASVTPKSSLAFTQRRFLRFGFHVSAVCVPFVLAWIVPQEAPQSRHTLETRATGLFGRGGFFVAGFAVHQRGGDFNSLFVGKFLRGLFHQFFNRDTAQGRDCFQAIAGNY